jgi:hypothetical protein
VVIRAIAQDVRLVPVFRSLVPSSTREAIIVIKSKKKVVSFLRALVQA